MNTTNYRSLSEIAECERSGRYGCAALGYLRNHQEHPELSFYIDGFFRCLKKCIGGKAIGGKGLSKSLKKEIWETFGFMPLINEKAMPKLAFVDHSYHGQTLSSMFFVECLRQEFDVDIFWSKSWRELSDNHLVDVLVKYDRLVFWQVFPEVPRRNLENKNLTIVPMWDAVYSKPDAFFKKYERCKFISFSEALKARLERLSIPSKKACPSPTIPGIVRGASKGAPTVLFWQRTKECTWEHVRQLIDPEQIGKLLLVMAPDPQNKVTPITLRDRRTYKVELLPWTNKKANYLEILKTVDLYIAPRMREGIGYSFLDAMSLGCVPIANNEATMNELINPRVGYLSDFRNASIVDVSNFRAKRNALYGHMKEMEMNWLRSSAEILNYVRADYEEIGNWN